MSTSPEIIPTDKHLNAFLENLIKPTLTSLSESAQRNLAISGFIMMGNEKAKAIAPLSAGKLEAPRLNGELRFHFREAFGNRLLMGCQCIFQQDQAVYSCSGFSLKGELKGETVKHMGWTVLYSVWDWLR